MPFDAIPNTTIETNPNADALELARKVEEILAVPERWCQGIMCDGEAQCIAGAFLTLLDENPITPGVYAVRNRIRELCGGDIIYWNDDPLRTHADIVALTRAVVASFE